MRRGSLVTSALAFAACLLSSTAFVGIKIGLRHSDPFSFAGIRFMISGLILVPLWWGKVKAMGAIRLHFKTVLIVCFFQTFLLYGLFYFGITMIPGALAAIVVGASPLTTAVLAHSFAADDRMTLPKAVSLCIGLGGVTAIALSRQPWYTPEGLAEFSGILIMLLSSVAGALGNILVAGNSKDIDPVLLNSAQIFLGGFFLFLLSIPLEGFPKIFLPLEYYGALLWPSVVSAAAVSLWFMLLKSPGVKVSELNLWKFIIPVFGAILSWMLLLEESPRLIPILAMICVGISILLFDLSSARQERGGLREGSDLLPRQTRAR